MLDPTTQSTLAKRLDRIEGRVGRIRLQVANGTLCPDLLKDLASAQDALSQVSVAVIKFHVGQCVATDTRDERDSAGKMGELVDIFDRFIR